MSCSCKGVAVTMYLWTSNDGTETKELDSLIAAKARVMRKGGSYKPLGE